MFFEEKPSKTAGTCLISLAGSFCGSKEVARWPLVLVRNWRLIFALVGEKLTFEFHIETAGLVQRGGGHVEYQRLAVGH